MQQLRRLFDDLAPSPQVYSLCFFERDALVPEVILVDAVSDDEALLEARDRRTFTTREVWQGHRLVAVIPPAR